MTHREFVLGIDYGTNSVRALIVDVASGEEVGTYVHNYVRGVDGIILDSSDHNFARQNPLDYVEGLEASVRGAVQAAEDIPGFSADKIVGIGVDTTGSTPLPVDEKGLPLSFQERFKDNPNAMAWLWKDHTSHAEAEFINRRAKEHIPDYTKYCGGIYSSEWYFSKILHLSKVDPEVFDASASFVEHCDLIPALLAGDTYPGRIKRSRCASGHKAMWNAEWGGLPSQEFLSSLSPKFDGLSHKLYKDTYTADVKVGGLCAEWAAKLGLREGIAVAGGAFDAHTGGVGSGVKPGTLVKIMGTSTCDLMVAPRLETQIPGICGQVDGSIIPGMVGIEAGQSAVGDIFAWYRDQIRWPIANLLPLSDISSIDSGKLDALMEEAKGLAFSALTDRAQMLRPGQSGLLSLDWLNGNRTILVNPNLTGLILGLTLGTRPEEIFMALIEGTAYGARVIIERIEEYGVDVTEIITGGGIAEKNHFLMQIYADVTGRPIKVSRSAQTCALGSAMFGAVAAGRFAKVEDASPVMTGVKEKVYMPNPESHKVYNRLFALYRKLHDSFGVKGTIDDVSGVMKELLDIRRSVG